MSEQTYLSLFTPTPIEIEPDHIVQVLKCLRVVGIAEVTRYSGPAGGWALFKAPWLEYPDEEILLQRVEVEDAHTFFVSGKMLNVHCIQGNPEDLRARVVALTHARFPDEVERDFYLNNLSVKFGPHDIFEAVENPSGTLFAQTTFSVSVWGYRHPSDLSAFRNFLLSSEIVRSAQSELSEILGQPVDAVIYLA